MATRPVKQDKATSRRRGARFAPENTTAVPRAATEPAPAEGTSPMGPPPDGGANSGPANHNRGEVGPTLFPERRL